MIKKEKIMICFENHEQIFDEHEHLDFDDLKIFFQIFDEQNDEIDDDLVLIWKIYFEIFDDELEIEEIQIINKSIKKKKKKSLYILKKFMKYLFLI